MIAGIRYKYTQVQRVLIDAGWEQLDESFEGETGAYHFWRAPNGLAVSVPASDLCMAQWDLELILEDGK